MEKGPYTDIKDACPDYSLAKHPTDGYIVRCYKDLCSGIDSWVDEVIDRDLRYSWADQKNPMPGREKAWLRQEILRHTQTESATLEKYPEANYLALSVLVRDFLRKHVWQEPYPVGTTQAEQSRIDQEIEAVNKIVEDNGNDEDKIVKGKCLRKLIWQHHYRRNQVQELKQISESVALTLIAWGYEACKCDELKDGLQGIFKQAALLHEKMRCSEPEYKMASPNLRNLRSPSTMSDQWVLWDFDQWQATSNVDKIAFYVGCIHFGLVRLQNQQRIIAYLCKPVMVVKSYDADWWADIKMPEAEIL